MYCGNINDLPSEEYDTPLVKYIRQAIKLNGSGRVELEKDMVFANFDTSNTELKQHRKFEYHKDFLDVHVILTGRETIGFTPQKFHDNSNIKHTFDTDKDLGFIEENLPCCYASLEVGDFAVFLPEELHKPLCATDDIPMEIKKIVLKVHKDFYRHCLSISV